MELRGLRYVVALAEELHFGRAARREFISSRPFSAVVHGVERELGVALFESTSRRVRLTGPGERFVAHARRVLAEADAMVEHARHGGPPAPPEKPGVVTVGVLGLGLAEHWSPLWEQVRAELPDLRAEYRDVDLVTQYEAVRTGEVDVGVVVDAGPIDGLVLEPVLAFAPIAVVPADSALAGANRLGLVDLLRSPGLALAVDPALARSWRALYLPAGAPVLADTGVRVPSALPAAVALTGRVAIHIEPARRYFPHPGVAYVPLDGAPIRVSVASRAGDERPAVRAFRRAARRLAEAAGGRVKT
ncbi:MAG TPA: LysR substrate-binding domain-containing protein [Pseudonocardia sp.]|jgi:DNA-binding transcriptional LysR family regulator|nr:LysR substrate-binding domain-containing protein [Pseudonocardia sp.]